MVSGAFLRLRNFRALPSVLRPVSFVPMKLKLSTSLALLAVTFVFSGCASRTNSSGGKETTLLGGAMVVAKDSFQPPTPNTLNADTSKIVGSNGPSGKKVSILWGLITLHDY